MIGLRVLKSGVAVFLAAVVSDLLNFSTPFFACMTAFISMEKTLLTSLQLGKNRVLGTAIGAVVGGLLSFYFPGNKIVAGIAVMICIKICTKLKLHGAIFISGIVCIACLIHNKSISGIEYAFDRTLHTFVGMVISIMLNVLLLPYYNISRLAQLQDKLISAIKSQDFGKIEQSFVCFKENVELYRNEILKKSKKIVIEKYYNNLSSFEKIYDIFKVLNSIDDVNTSEVLNKKINQYLKQIDSNI